MSISWPADHEARARESFGACVDASDNDQLTQNTDMSKNIVGGCVATRFEHPEHNKGKRELVHD